MHRSEPNLFEFKDYKDYIRVRIQSSDRPRGMIASFAQAAGCHRTYFSQVLNSHVHLTPDQACGLANHWSFPRLEADYFCLLVDYQRAATPRLRAKINDQLHALGRRRDNLGHRFKKGAIGPGEIEMLYYSTWYVSAIHVLTSIPEFQYVQKISERLGLPLRQVTSALEKLEAHGFVRRNDERWIITTRDLHLPSHAPFNAINHANWRQRAAHAVQALEPSGVHYTSVASMSRRDFEKLKTLVLAFIDESRRMVAASEEEELICLTCDLFQA